MEKNQRPMVNFEEWRRYGCPLCCRTDASITGMFKGTVYSVVKCAYCRELFAIMFSSDYMEERHFSDHGTIELAVRTVHGEKKGTFNFRQLVQAAFDLLPIVVAFRDHEFVLQSHPRSMRQKRKKT